MGWESPASTALRLRRICDAQPMLRDEILPLLAVRVDMESSGWSPDASPSIDMLLSSLHDDSFSSPPADVLRASTTSAATEQLGERVTSLQASLAGQLLMTVESQTSALALVLAAHERGAITLPASLLAAVAVAHSRLPAFLNSRVLI